MSSMREVLVHRRRRTVHELRQNGTTRCGNGLTSPGDYEKMKANEVEASARDCLRCAWIIERRPLG